MAEIDPKATQVYATGIAFAHGALDETAQVKRNRVEAAMTKAIADAQAEGIGDPDVIRARILAARDVVVGR